MEKLPLPVLSNMLWAAFGINRPETGRRTAPTAMNWQEIDIYVTTADGLYLYEAKEHKLIPILQEDIRAKAGKQEFVAEAPVNLVYVADYAKMDTSTSDANDLFANVATGAIAQNVYLFCASEGLATVVRAWIDKPALKEAMKLRSDQKIILSQTVGYPKKK
jgi:SagB-type dehydrogenase family enzyme